MVNYIHLINWFWEDVPYRDGYKSEYGMLFMALVDSINRNRWRPATAIDLEMILNKSGLEKRMYLRGRTWLAEQHLIDFEEGHKSRSARFTITNDVILEVQKCTSNVPQEYPESTSSVPQAYLECTSSAPILYKQLNSKTEKQENGETEGLVGADAPTTEPEVKSALLASPSLTPPSQQPPNGATQKPPGSAAPPKPAAQPKPDLETRRDAFKESVRDYYRNNRTKYPDTMYPAFIAYWAESDGKKMRWEKETVFEIPNRLSTWHQRETKSVAPNKTLQVNGNGRNTRTEPVPGQPFGKL